MAMSMPLRTPGQLMSPSPTVTIPEELGNRSIYLGGIDPNTTAEEILSQVHCGLIDSIKILPEKGCAFISFVDPISAQLFFRETSLSQFVVREREIKVGWGKPKPLPQEVLHAIENGATRNVFVGGIDETMDEAFFRKEFERFGEVEHVKVIQDKRVAFVHFIALNSALKCVSTIQKEPTFSRCKVNYGKDRCNKRGPLHQMDMGMGAMAHLSVMGGMGRGMPGLNNGAYGMGMNGGTGMNGMDPMGSLSSGMASMSMGGGGSNGMHSLGMGSQMAPGAPSYGYPADRGQSQFPQDVSRARGGMSSMSLVPRTVYIGGIDASTTAEELCEYVKGGVLDNIKVMPEKNCAFVTFVFPEGAQTFYEYALQGFLLKGRQVKVGWGKPSNIPSDLANAVHRGASRNVYIGNVDEYLTEQRIWDELSAFGSIESVSFVPEKRCIFVSFTSLMSALRAVDNLCDNPRYQHYRINFGKDVCARLPPRGATGHNGYQSSGAPARSMVGYNPAPPVQYAPPTYAPSSYAPPSYSSQPLALPPKDKLSGVYAFPGLDQIHTGFGSFY